MQIVITPAGKEFITPITLSALTSKPVISEFFSQRDGTWHSHVDLGLWADAMVITGNRIIHRENGSWHSRQYADNNLSFHESSGFRCSGDGFRYVCSPPATQHNLDILRSYGNHIIEPASGETASHLVGKGRMEEPEKIIEVLEDFFAKQQDLTGKEIVITAGPTYEKMSKLYTSSPNIHPEKWDMHLPKPVRHAELT